MYEKILLACATAALLAGPAFAQSQGDNRDDDRSGRIDRAGDGNSGQGDDRKLRDEMVESLKERARARRHGARENEPGTPKQELKAKPRLEEKGCKAQPKPPCPPTCPPRPCAGKQGQKPVLNAPSNPCRGKPSHGPHRK